MTVSETLIAACEALRYDIQQVPGIYERRIFAESPYSLSIGISQPAGLRVLFLTVSRRSVRGRLEIETRGFRLHAEPYSGLQDVRIRLEETHRSFADLFGHLCLDVVGTVLASLTEELAVEGLRTRVTHWQRFMERASEGLSPSEQLGLYGELYFLRKLIVTGCTAVTALDGWQGPLSANHDFMFRKMAVEIKSTASNSDSRVYISNERQLDDTGIAILYLGCLSFDKREHSETTLPVLVDQIAGMLGLALIPAFEDRLLAAGYHRLQAGLYDDVGYTERRTRYYRISEMFPRIVPPDLKTGVQNVRYEVELSSAIDCLITEAEVFEAIT
jgi:hypothetical protein